MKLTIPISNQGRLRQSLKIAGLACVLAGIAAMTSGCAGYYQPGYSRAYYAPDYTPYYADYGYGGDSYPYGGYDEIVVGGNRHRGYYGHHHLGGEFGARAHAGRGGGGGFHGSGGHGGAGHGIGGGGGGHGGGHR
jgi:hypothetical protein